MEPGPGRNVFFLSENFFIFLCGPQRMWLFQK